MNEKPFTVHYLTARKDGFTKLIGFRENELPHAEAMRAALSIQGYETMLATEVPDPNMTDLDRRYRL